MGNRRCLHQLLLDRSEVSLEVNHGMFSCQTPTACDSRPLKIYFGMVFFGIMLGTPTVWLSIPSVPANG